MVTVKEIELTEIQALINKGTRTALCQVDLVCSFDGVHFAAHEIFAVVTESKNDIDVKLTNGFVDEAANDTVRGFVAGQRRLESAFAAA